MSTGIQPESNPRTRRSLLAGAVGGVAAVAAGMIGRAKPTRADDGDPLILGAVNLGSNTKIETDEQNTALILNSGDVGLDAFGGIYGVKARSVGEFGVLAESENGIALQARSTNSYALVAIANRRYAGWFEGRVRVSRFVDIGEIVTPAKPPANVARLFVRENTVGHTQLCVRFPNGNVRVLATA
jgi:hypothetical protein